MMLDNAQPASGVTTWSRLTDSVGKFPDVGHRLASDWVILSVRGYFSPTIGNIAFRVVQNLGQKSCRACRSFAPCDASSDSRNALLQAPKREQDQQRDKYLVNRVSVRSGMRLGDEAK